MYISLSSCCLPFSALTLLLLCLILLSPTSCCLSSSLCCLLSSSCCLSQSHPPVLTPTVFHPLPPAVSHPIISLPHPAIITPLTYLPSPSITYTRPNTYPPPSLTYPLPSNTQFGHSHCNRGRMVAKEEKDVRDEVGMRDGVEGGEKNLDVDNCVCYCSSLI